MKKFTYYSRSVPSFTAMSSYSCLLLAISSRQPKQVSWEAATREARVSPVIRKNNCTTENANSAWSLLLFMLSSHTMRMGRMQPGAQTWTSLVFYHPALNVASSIHSFTWKGLPQRFINDLPGIVTMGVPAQRTSIPVVCPLQSGYCLI